MFGLAIWGGLTFGSVHRRGRLRARRLRRGLGVRGDRAAARAARRAARPGGRPAAPAGERGGRRRRARRGGRRTARRPTSTRGAGAAALRAVRARARRCDPGVALALANVGYGTMAGFVVLLLDQRGIGHGATAFTVFAGVGRDHAPAARPPARPRRPAAHGARRRHRRGPRAWRPLGLAQSLPAALAAAALMGMGMSLLFPSLALLVVDRVPDERRGAAMGAFTAFFDLGFGLGAPFAGLVASAGRRRLPGRVLRRRRAAASRARSSAGSRPRDIPRRAVPA